MSQQVVSSLSNPAPPDVGPLQAAVLSAVLLTLSLLHFPLVPLEFFAWVWMVPLLLALRHVTTFGKWMGCAFLATLGGWLGGGLYLMFGGGWPTVLIFLENAIVQTLPFAALFLVWKAFGWRSALWSFPLFGAACGWLHQTIPGTICWFDLGCSQARFTWLIQWIDLTGTWGLTAWLGLGNVLVTSALEDWQKHLTVAPASARRFAVRRMALVLLVFLGPPLLYAGFVFGNTARQPAAAPLGVVLVQPNVAPAGKEEPEDQNIGRLVNQTETALQAAPRRPDLVLWPETAVAHPLRQDQLASDFIARNLRRWNTSLVTGTFDSRERQIFNAAVLLTPENSRSTPDRLPVYHKRNLMPFMEYVPWAGQSAWLANLTGRHSPALTKGRSPAVFTFRSQAGRSVTVAPAICYDQFYPATLAEQVRQGAEAVVLLTNEGWFSESLQQGQIAHFSILRSIELRRPIARCANTGKTCVIDEYGRISGELPLWEEQATFAELRPTRHLSFYVRHPDLFPKICVWLTIVVVGSALGRVGRRETE